MRLGGGGVLAKERGKFLQDLADGLLSREASSLRASWSSRSQGPAFLVSGGLLGELTLGLVELLDGVEIVHEVVQAGEILKRAADGFGELFVLGAESFSLLVG